MRVLGLDTATRATSVALLHTGSAGGAGGAGGVAIERRDDPPGDVRPRHTTRLLALVLETLEAASADWPQVDRIAVGVGPGTFTGVRIGISSARGLAAARGLPIVGVSTLQALAASAVPDALAAGRAGVLAVLDARRREVFAAGWAAGPDAADPSAAPLAADAPGATPRFAPRAIAPAALASALRDEGGTWLAVGDGAVLCRETLEAAGALVPDDGSPLHRVSAIAHCRLAAGLAPATPGEIHPDYLRLPDAELARRAVAPTPS